MKNISKWKHIPRSWIGRLNIKMLIQFKSIYRFNTMPIKQHDVFYRDRRIHSKTHMECQVTFNSQNKYEKNKTGSITLPNAKLYYKGIVNKIVY